MQRPKRTPHSTRTENSSRLIARSLFDRSCLARPEPEGRRTCLATSILLSGRLRGELPSRDANSCAGRVPASAHMAEQDPVRRDADRLVPASDPHLRPADTQRAGLGMDSEDLWHGPDLRPRRRRRSMTSMQASWVFAQVVVPGRGAKIPPWRGAGAEGADGFAPLDCLGRTRARREFREGVSWLPADGGADGIGAPGCIRLTDPSRSCHGAVLKPAATRGRDSSGAAATASPSSPRTVLEPLPAYPAVELRRA